MCRLCEMYRPKNKGRMCFSGKSACKIGSASIRSATTDADDCDSSHSPASWKSMWLEHIDGKLEVTAYFQSASGVYPTGTVRDMYWSVRIK